MEPELIKKSRFKNFLKLIKKERENVIKETILPPEDDARKIVDTLLDKAIKDKDSEKILLILKRGFDINTNQFFEIFSAQVYNEYKNHRSEIMPFIYRKYNIDMREEIDKLLLDFTVNPQHSEKYGENSFTKIYYKIFNVWKVMSKEKEFSDKDYALEFRELLINFRNKMKTNREDLPDTVFQTIYTLQDYIEKRYESHFKQVKENARQGEMLEFNQQLNCATGAFNNIKNIRDHIKLGLRENIKKLDSVKMPNDAQKIVEEISKIVSELTPLELNAKQNFDFENLYNKRLPQVLEEYINISPRYKEMLKSHNENPDTILVDSLKEIKSRVEEIFMVVQEDNFNKQKVTRQYLKSI